MGKYRDTRKKAKEIADIGETGRLIIIGVERNKQKADANVEAYIESCDQAREYLVQVFEDYNFELESTTIEDIQAMPLTTLDECKKLGQEMREIHIELKESSNIPGVFYPFFPTSISRLSFTTIELLLFFVIGILLYFVL